MVLRVTRSVMELAMASDAKFQNISNPVSVPVLELKRSV